ncbi:N-acetylglucosaminidase [Rouxiella sp. Mn2063]|uniref:N-acetylglucosaminidase n=1 Tax=Rouxiella sp. Mn2063 TaxID=3395262 RepID=UPI003BEB3FB3
MALEAGGIKIPVPRIRTLASACDYGPSLQEKGFDPIFTHSGAGKAEFTSLVIPGQQAGDVVVIQPIAGHPDGHIAMFNGLHWVSDFVQYKGFYPGPSYRNIKPAFILYRYNNNKARNTEVKDTSHNITIGYPIPKNKKGSDFTQLDEILSHLDGESTGLYMIGRNGMWHGGIHITNATTLWCALSGKSIFEKVDFPVSYTGEQFVRCMADGDVVAYRVCQDYLPIKWGNGALSFSGSFLLVRHYIQPGKTAKSGLHFYTLYMHLAPHSAYQTPDTTPLWAVQDTLTVYQPEWLLSASHSHTHRAGVMPKGALIEWDDKDGNLRTRAFNQRDYGLVRFKGLTEAMKKKGVKTTLTEGEQYWILVDNNNIKLVEEELVQPAWWSHLQVPSSDVMQYDRIVCPTPYPIHAGDAVGHLGYCQVPKDGGYESRYQVHIECFSMDDNLPTFLTNPEKVGHDNPLYLKYLPGLALYKKETKTGTFSKEERVTRGSAILPLAKVPVESHKNKAGLEEYYQLKEGYVLKSEKTPERLSQYDLAKLGFTLIKDNPDSFDHLNGKTQPKGLVRSIYEQLLHHATIDLRVSHALVSHNYQRLLDKIDGHPQGKYSPEEYRRAIHNPSYIHELYKIIVRHPSDWFHKKEDGIWQTFLNELKKEAPGWKTYSEDFLDKMAWMQEVTTEKLGPELWHMHPLMFLGAIRQLQRYIIKHTRYDYTLDEAINKQMSIPGNAAPKWGILRNATRGEVTQEIKPSNLFSNIQMLQFLEIDKPMGISVELLNDFLKGKGSLDGTAAAFIQAAHDFNINECYLAAHAAIETGNGTSVLGKGSLFSYNHQESRKVYNMFGIAAVDGNAVGGGKAAAYSRGWFTPELAIRGGAGWISQKFVNKKQNTLYKMRWNPSSPSLHQYATAVNWPSHIVTRMYEICGDYHEYNKELYFDIPVYKESAQ